MKLYSGPLSLFARKIEIALGEKNLSFERIMAPFTQTEGYTPKLPEIMAANPKGQVPVLIDGDVTLYDSTVILEYLEDAYPDPPLYPKNASARARCRLLELYADEVMLVPLKALMHRSEPWDDAPRRSALEVKARDAETVLANQFARLDADLGEGAYFCGAFGAADIALFMSVHYAQRLGGPALGRTKRLADWYAALGARPAFKTVIDEIRTADRALSRQVPGAFKGLD